MNKDFTLRECSVLLADPALECECGAQPYAVSEILRSEPPIETVRVECFRCGLQTGQFYELGVAKAVFKGRHGKMYGWAHEEIHE